MSLPTPMTVSVVIATRDRPQELRESIAAVVAQGYNGPVEVLVVHDRSTPDESLARSENDRTVRVLANDRSPGLAGARNTGILAATGEIVAFCDDDDVWLPGKLTRQLAVFSTDPLVQLVACGIRVRYAGALTDRLLDRDTVTFEELLRSRLTELHPSTFCMRRSALIDGFGLVEEDIPGSYAEDYEFLLRAARAHPLHTVPEVLVEVRWHQQSFFEGRWETISTALQWLLGRYPEFAHVPAGYARVAGQIAFAEAARRRPRPALQWAWRTLRRNPKEGRAYLAALVTSHLVTPEVVLRRLHASGKGL